MDILETKEFDEEGRNVAEWIKAEFVEYELSELDRKSLVEIKNMLHNNLYVEEETLTSHMEFLDHLANKIDTALTEEGDMGRNNFLLQKSLKVVNSLQEALANKVMGFGNNI